MIKINKKPRPYINYFIIGAIIFILVVKKISGVELYFGLGFIIAEIHLILLKMENHLLKKEVKDLNDYIDDNIIDH